MSLVNLINIREFREEDTNFVLDSFMSCLSKYRESIFKGWEHKDIYQHLEQILLFALTKIPSYSIFLAVGRNNEQNIYSYLIADSTRNHVLFAYTKHAYRGLGLQKHMLLPLLIDLNQPITVNFPTKEALKLQRLGKISIKNIFLEQLMEAFL